jgi:hypothetical protein
MLGLPELAQDLSMRILGGLLLQAIEFQGGLIGLFQPASLM